METFLYNSFFEGFIAQLQKRAEMRFNLEKSQSTEQILPGRSYGMLRRLASTTQRSIVELVGDQVKIAKKKISLLLIEYCCN